MRWVASITKSSRSRSSAAESSLRVEVLEREHAERHVARLVGHDAGRDVLDQRLVGPLQPHHAEGREREAFHHDLHAEVGHVPARVGDDVVEQHAQVAVDAERDARASR